MKKYIPNALSFSRVGFAVALICLGNHHPVWSATCLAVGISTDWLDGELARRFGAATAWGADKVEPVCDTVLIVSAVSILIHGGHWPLGLGVGLLVAAVLLQLIHEFRALSPFMERLKRHQQYVHPFFAVIIMIAALGTYVHVAAVSLTTSSSTLFITTWVYCGVVVVALLLKRERIWFMVGR